MAAAAFSETLLSAFESMLDAGDGARYQSTLEAYDLHTCYRTDMGRLMLAAELEANVPVQKADTEVKTFRICKREDDLRCQVGHVLSNLKSRSTRRGSGHGVDDAYAAFRRNAKATVLIVDKSGLEIGKPNDKGKIRLRGVESRHALDLSKFSRNAEHRELLLCDHYFYANELIPDTDIYGSGFFIDHDKVVTAAHVLDEAFYEKVKPENLMFIRGHYTYQTGMRTLEVFENQLYVLDQPKLLIREQIRNGSIDGDMAWVNVRPYFKGKAYPFQWNGFAPEPVKKGARVYALGHGLGVPMKLSFGGEVQDEMYNNTPAMFACDINILPGSSGSPIFDADSHRLVGIVSGLHEIYTDVVITENCVELKINMKDEFSGIATHIAPFRNL